MSSLVLPSLTVRDFLPAPLGPETGGVGQRNTAAGRELGRKYSITKTDSLRYRERCAPPKVMTYVLIEGSSTHGAGTRLKQAFLQAA
jgi:hypothetical protein